MEGEEKIAAFHKMRFRPNLISLFRAVQNYSETSENFWKGMSVWLEAEGPPLGLPFTGGIGMSIKGETERPKSEKYNLEIDGNTTCK